MLDDGLNRVLECQKNIVLKDIVLIVLLLICNLYLLVLLIKHIGGVCCLQKSTKSTE